MLSIGILTGGDEKIKKVLYLHGEDERLLSDDDGIHGRYKIESFNFPRRFETGAVDLEVAH
jgi:hypothetical protein